MAWWLVAHNIWQNSFKSYILNFVLIFFTGQIINAYWDKYKKEAFYRSQKSWTKTRRSGATIFKWWKGAKYDGSIGQITNYLTFVKFRYFELKI